MGQASPQHRLEHDPNLDLPANFADPVDAPAPEWGHGYQPAAVTVMVSPQQRPPPISPKSSTARTSSPPQDQLRDASPNPSLKEELEQENQPPQLQEPLQNKNKDFVTAYTTILSVEQRTRYKQEFNEHYTNYRKLHCILDRVSKRFTDLENKLKEQVKDSPEFKRVQSQIVSEYANNKRDMVYQNARHQFQYLHEKLAHIKMLVHEYDTTNIR
jgi:RNA polymerase II elongation factor ELL